MSSVRWWALVGLLWVAALWRAPGLPGPWTPDWLLLALLGWAFAQRSLPSSASAIGRGAVVGGLKDVASSGLFGGWLVVFAGAAWLATRGARAIARDDAVAQIAWVAVFAGGTIAAQAIWLGLQGDGAIGIAVVTQYGLASPVATGLSSLVIFPLVKRAAAP
ncbi:MAG: rod shape-determining protein MreD [Candidatus Omnitrophica bacterium]|nr:rod shape-determining protein MreD [Candidatus Omnitrophota bacterium]